MRYIYIGAETELAKKAQTNAAARATLTGVLAGQGSPLAWLTTVLGALAGKESHVELHAKSTENAAERMLRMLGYDPPAHILTARSQPTTRKPRMAFVIRDARGRPCEAIPDHKLAGRLRAGAEKERSEQLQRDIAEDIGGQSAG